MSGGWVHDPKTYRTFLVDDGSREVQTVSCNEAGKISVEVCREIKPDGESREILTEFLNQRRIKIFHDKDRQKKFLNLLDNVLAMANINRANATNRYDPDHPKLNPGERFDAPEINMAKLIAASLVDPFEQIFQTGASGKESSVFFELVNLIFSLINLKTEGGQEVALGKDALKTVLSGKARKKV